MDNLKKLILKIWMSAIKAPHIVLLLSLLCICIYIWFLAIEQYPLNPDAGYYLTAGKYIVNGLAPFNDFHTAYSPGVFYIFALLEKVGSEFGNYQKLITYLIHLLNGFLLAVIFLRLNFSKNLAFTGGTLFVLAAFSLDGQAIVLEPFQNIFILSSFLAAISLKYHKAAIISGLFLGFGLMAKQSSMFSMPVIAMLIAFPFWFQLTTDKEENKGFIKRLSFFGLSISLPFVLFCILTQQSLITAFIKLATLGGKAKSYVGLKYTLYDVIDTFISVGGGSRLLIPMIVVAALVLFFSKNNMHRLLLVGFLFNLMTILFVRGYPHYIQLLMPWGILLLISLISILNRECKKIENIIIMLAIIPFIAPVLSTAHNLRIQFSKKPIIEQRELSYSIKTILGNKEKTIIIGDPWLYYTNNIVADEYNLGFIKAAHQIEERINNANFIVVMPQKVDLFKSSSDFEKFKNIGQAKYENSDVLVYQRE